MTGRSTLLEVQRSHVRTLPRELAGWVLPDRVELGTFSKAQGPWTVDWKRARRAARAALDAIDFSRPEVIVWIPGTDASSVHHDFRQAVDYVYGNGHRGASLSHMPYEASWELRSSLPTGLATMKLMLEGIRQRLEAMPPSRRPKIRLAGLSQGAWIIGEALADPRAGAVVDRAVLAGHPWLAKTQYLDGHDPRVRVINHRGDQIAMEVHGDIGVGMDAMSAVKTGALGANIGKVARSILANPIHGVLLLEGYAREIPWLRPFLRDPHVYGMEMPRLVRYLKDGILDVTDEEIDDAKRRRLPSSFIG
jgi:hypothetical protein